MNPLSASSSSTPASNSNNSLMFPLKHLPPEIVELIETKTLQSRAKEKLFKYQSLIISEYANHAIRTIGIHPKYLFLHIFRIPYLLSFGFPKMVLPFLWYLCQLYTIVIEFPTPNLDLALHTKTSNPINTSHLHTFLQWFRPIKEWIKLLNEFPHQPFLYILFRRPFTKDGFKPLLISCCHNSPFMTLLIQSYRSTKQRCILYASWTSKTFQKNNSPFYKKKLSKIIILNIVNNCRLPYTNTMTWSTHHMNSQEYSHSLYFLDMLIFLSWHPRKPMIFLKTLIGRKTPLKSLTQNFQHYFVKSSF